MYVPRSSPFGVRASIGMHIFARETLQMLVQKLNPWRGDPLDYRHSKGVERRISQNAVLDAVRSLGPDRKI